MANKQTAGLQLIDLKGIDLLNGPVKIKGVYQQVIANKFIKTITNLVYDGYAYDDFPITLTTTDGLTYTGKYIDTVSSEMLQWLSITINNKSEVTVTKELFEGGGGGYEEITEGNIYDKSKQADLIIFKPSKEYKGNVFTTEVYGLTPQMQRHSSTTVYVHYGDVYVLRNSSKFVTKSSFCLRLNNSQSQSLVINYSTAPKARLTNYGAGGMSSNNSMAITAINPLSQVEVLESDLKFYRDKALSKLLQSI